MAAIRLYPVDDSERDPAFRAYVRKLRSAVQAHNAHALKKLVDDEVIAGPAGEPKGWKQFSAKWHPEDAESALWPALADILALGFVREHPSLFLSPYVVWRFPRNLNRASYLVVIKDKVALRKSPSIKAPAGADVSFAIVQQIGKPQAGEGLGEWVLVRTDTGETGYLNMRDALSPTMPRAQFAKREGRWVMIALESEAR